MTTTQAVQCLSSHNLAADEIIIVPLNREQFEFCWNNMPALRAFRSAPAAHHNFNFPDASLRELFAVCGSPGEMIVHVGASVEAEEWTDWELTLRPNRRSPGDFLRRIEFAPEMAQDAPDARRGAPRTTATSKTVLQRRCNANRTGLANRVNRKLSETAA
jgi:hypothetical protein